MVTTSNIDEAPLHEAMTVDSDVPTTGILSGIERPAEVARRRPDRSATAPTADSRARLAAHDVLTAIAPNGLPPSSWVPPLTWPSGIMNPS